MQVLKENVKEKIYQTAIEEFYKKGFLKAKMQDIAKKAGISVGLIYSYYNNKEYLFAAIAEPIYKEIIQSIENEEKRDSKMGDPANLFEQETAFILQLLRQKREIRSCRSSRPIRRLIRPAMRQRRPIRSNNAILPATPLATMLLRKRRQLMLGGSNCSRRGRLNGYPRMSSRPVGN